MRTQGSYLGCVIVSGILAAMMSVVGGCQANEEEPEAVGGAAEAELREGAFTFVRTEIGYMVTNGMSFCTATLISPNVVLTAAHCVGYGTADAHGEKQGWFTVERSAAEHHDFDYDAYLSYGTSWGRDDVALLRLKTAVPSDLAKPAELATEAPTDSSNEQVTLFGYGCSSRPGVFGGGGWDDHSQKKQMRQFEMGPVRYVCPGDSGGPTVRGLNGGIFRVSSRMFSFEIFGLGNPDSFGDVVRHRTAILDQVRAWAKE